MIQNPIQLAIAHRARVETAMQHLPETAALEYVELYPLWHDQLTCQRGTIVRDDGYLHRALHDITVPEENRKPSEDTTNQKWQRIGNPADEYPEWTDPMGIPANFYQQGDKVTYNGKHWVSDVNNNSWQPGAYGWSEVE